ncbi:MAG TPA: substrate-binding domain-containing protein [Terriglobales bacterium]|nr:substrate-binding domain-containing protein [Terriglobales bacterium]
MTKPRFLLSVTNDDNDFQIEQVKTARHAASQAGVELEILCARDDGILQSQQLLDRIQSPVDFRPNAILCEPAGSTALPQVARAAASAGIGWALLSRNAEYLNELRSIFHVPAFVVTPDHEKIGGIQGRQLGALLPGGGLVLYIQGPSHSLAAKQRYAGTLETKPENIQLRVLRAHWTESSAHKAVTSWLCLSTSRAADLRAVCAQDDSMALGARRAFEESTSKLRESWLKIPFLGIDGLPNTGQTWVRSGLLTATVFSPLTAGIAIEQMARFLGSGTMPPVCTVTEPKSIPDIEELARRARTASAK